MIAVAELSLSSVRRLFGFATRSRLHFDGSMDSMCFSCISAGFLLLLLHFWRNELQILMNATLETMPTIRRHRASTKYKYIGAQEQCEAYNIITYFIRVFCLLLLVIRGYSKMSHCIVYWRWMKLATDDMLFHVIYCIFSYSEHWIVNSECILFGEIHVVWIFSLSMARLGAYVDLICVVSSERRCRRTQINSSCHVTKVRWLHQWLMGNYTRQKQNWLENFRLHCLHSWTHRSAPWTAICIFPNRLTLTICFTPMPRR